MDLSLILKVLKEAGYIAKIHKSINSVLAGVPDTNNEPKFDSIFRVELKQRKILLVYFTGQIPNEKEFQSIEEFLDFIKEIFSINNS